MGPVPVVANYGLGTILEEHVVKRTQDHIPDVGFPRMESELRGHANRRGRGRRLIPVTVVLHVLRIIEWELLEWIDRHKCLRKPGILTLQFLQAGPEARCHIQGVGVGKVHQVLVRVPLLGTLRFGCVQEGEHVRVCIPCGMGVLGVIRRWFAIGTQTRSREDLIDHIHIWILHVRLGKDDHVLQVTAPPHHVLMIQVPDRLALGKSTTECSRGILLLPGGMPPH